MDEYQVFPLGSNAYNSVGTLSGEYFIIGSEAYIFDYNSGEIRDKRNQIFGKVAQPFEGWVNVVGATGEAIYKIYFD